MIWWMVLYFAIVALVVIGWIAACDVEDMGD